jgi:Anaphase-promoting complex subunit 4 WD40 domain
VLKEAFFTANGEEIWTRGSDDRLRRWNAATGAEVGHISVPDPAASCLLSPNGQWLGAADRLGNIRLIDVATMKEKHSFSPEAAGIGCNIEFSPDSKSLAVVSRVGRSGFVYDVVAGKMRLELPLPSAPSINQPMAAGAVRPIFDSGVNLPRRLMFSRDSRLIAIASDGFITVWDAAHGRQVGQIRCERHDLLRHAALSPDDRTIAIERSSATTIWELATNTKRQTLDSSKLPLDDPGSMRFTMLGTAAFAMTLAYSPDGRLLARAGEDRKIRLWDVWTGKEVGSFEGHRGALVSASFAPEGNRLVTASTDTTALVWDIASIREKLPRSGAVLNEKQLATHWQGLIELDGVKAFESIQALAGDPANSLALLSARIKPAEGPEVNALAKLTADLSDAKFATRERARKELEHLGEAAAPALRQTVDSSPSAEARRVAKKILDGLQTVVLSGERLRELRAVEVLERVGTPEAIELLKKLAGGAAETIPTPQARAALERLAARK